MKQFCKRGHDRTLPGALNAAYSCRKCTIVSVSISRKTNKEKHKLWASNYYKSNTQVCVMRNKQWRRNNKKKSNDYTRKWRKNNPGLTPESNWRSRGIKDMTYERYLRLKREQGDKCAICNKHSNNFVYALAVDHNHETGKSRGLLCSTCNRYIVGAIESPLYKKALAYLDKYNEAA